MVRKFFAALLILVFAFLLVPLVLLQSVRSTFFTEEGLRTRVFPAIYGPLTEMLSQEVSRSPQEAGLIRQRLRQAVSPEQYGEWLLAAARPFLGNEFSSEIDLRPLKNILKDDLPAVLEKLPACGPGEQPQERLCRPAGQTPQSFAGHMAQIVEKEIPPQVPLKAMNDPQVRENIQTFMRVKEVLPAVLVILSAVFLGLVGLLIFSPWTRVVKWEAFALATAALLLTLFLVSVAQLDLTAKVSEGFSPSQTQLAQIIISQPLALLQLWVFLLWGAAVLLFGSGLVGASKHKKS